MGCFIFPAKPWLLYKSLAVAALLFPALSQVQELLEAGSKRITKLATLEKFNSTVIHAPQFCRGDGHRAFFHWEEGDKGQTALAPHSREMTVNFLIFPSIFSQLLDVWEEKEVIQDLLWLSTTLLHFGLVFVLRLHPIVSWMSWFLPPHCYLSIEAAEIACEETAWVCLSGLGKIPFKCTERFQRLKQGLVWAYAVKTILGKFLGFKLWYPFRTHKTGVFRASLSQKIEEKANESWDPAWEEKKYPHNF